MSCTFLQARDDMMKIVTDAWVAANPTYPLVYDDMPTDGPPETKLPWARLTLRHNRGEQETLTNAIGQRLFGRDGLLTVQIFTPRGEGLTRAYQLAKVVADALEGKSTPNGVWFRAVRIREVGPDGGWFQLNVTADFEYNEAK